MLCIIENEYDQTQIPHSMDMEEDGNLLGSHKPVALFQLCWIRL